VADSQENQQSQQNQDHNSPQNDGQTKGVGKSDQGGGAAKGDASGAADGGAAGGTSKAQPPEEAPAKKIGRRIIIGAVILLIILGAGLWYWHSTYTEDTDDAQVDGDIYQVSSRVSGQVTKVLVEDNTRVKKGDVLLEMDPTDFRVSLEQAEAALAAAKADAVQATANVPITSVTTSTQTRNSGVDVATSDTGVSQAQQQAAAAAARVEQAQANAIKATKDVERYTPLVEKDVISRQQYDAAVAAATAANASVVESQKQLTAQQAMIVQAQQRVQQAKNQEAQAARNGPEQVRAQQARAQSMQASVEQAQARVDQAKLNLSYTRVVAPVDGIVNKKNVEVGGNLSIGQDLLTIIPINDLWVTANFKETQLNEIHRCQLVNLQVDALDGRKFHGKITQIGGATGSRLSLFPPENATGNYVKVVQRIPVRIDFTNLDKENADLRLRPGFSVTPYVDVKGSGDYKDTSNCEKGLPEKQNN
jgi:membrane fusion protein (multidrug efflux system)